MDPNIQKMIEEKRKQAQELRKRKMEERLQQQQRQANGQQPFVDAPKIQKFSTNTNNFMVKNVFPKGHQNFPKSSPQKNIFYSSSSNSPTKSNVGQNLFSQRSNASTSYTQIKNHDTQQNPSQPPVVYKVSISLESCSRFMITVDYQSDIIAIFKRLDSKRWDPVTKNWSFSIKEYKEIINQMKSLSQEKNLEIKFENLLPDNIIKAMNEYLERSKMQIDLNERLESAFLETLFPYQRDGIIFGIQREGKLMIADDMGLGKTIQAIGLAIWFRQDWPLLIVCPSSLKYQWMSSILKWIPDLSETQVFVANDTKNAFPKVPVTITSYELMSIIQNRFSIDANRFYSMMIIDESHYLKSDSTQRSSTASNIARSCKRIILLSGTPALSRPIELFPQLNIINKDMFPSKHTFGIRYCDAKQKTIFRGGRPVSIWDYRGSQNLNELKIILSSTIMIRREKSNVLSDLPSKKREIILLNMDHLEEKERYELQMLRNRLRNVKKHADRNSITFELFGKSAQAKVPAVMEYLEQFIENNDNETRKLLCFCHHMSMMDGLQSILNQKRINHIRLDGSTSAKVRQEACDTFQKRKDFRIALLSVTACSTGLNLTAASLVIFAETFWNPGVLAQAEDRVYRIGQKENVRIIYLLGRGTIDEVIWPLLSKKLDILNRVGLSRDTFQNTHNPLDIDDNQSVLTEFINVLSQNLVQEVPNENNEQISSNDQK